jgi:hypothetical protein
MLIITLDTADQITALDRARTDGGLGVVYDGTHYLCRDVRGDAAYPEYQELIADAVPLVHPLTCSAAQGRLALLQAGLLDDVEAWVATQDRVVQIEYEARNEWRRDWPLVIDAAGELGLTDAQLDDLFTLAMTL